MLELKSELKNYSVNIPTDVSEFTPEILNSISENVDLPEHYCIVGLCHEMKLIDIAVNVNGDKEQQVSVIPILVKMHKEDLDKLKASVGRRVIINRTMLEHGTHIHLPIAITMSNVTRYIRDDEKLRKNLLMGGSGNAPVINIAPITSSKKDQEANKAEQAINKSPNVYVIEFKIVPVNSVHATIKPNSRIIDPFKLKKGELVS